MYIRRESFQSTKIPKTPQNVPKLVNEERRRRPIDSNVFNDKVFLVVVLSSTDHKSYTNKSGRSRFFIDKSQIRSFYLNFFITDLKTLKLQTQNERRVFQLKILLQQT